MVAVDWRENSRDQTAEQSAGHTLWWNCQHKSCLDDNYHSTSYQFRGGGGGGGRVTGSKKQSSMDIYWNIWNLLTQIMLKGPIVSQLLEQRISRTKKSLKMNFTGFSHHDILLCCLCTTLEKYLTHAWIFMELILTETIIEATI